MLASVTLLRRTDSELFYTFSEVENVNDGIIIIDLKDIENSRIEEYPQYMENQLAIPGVLGKLMRKIVNGECPEKVFYACG